MRVRFSLKLLLLTIAFASLACYWLMLPTINAQRFIGAIELGDYKRADSYFRCERDRFLFKLNEKHWRFHARTELDPWSFGQLIRGHRVLRLYAAYGDAGPMISNGFTVIVTRAGLLNPEAQSWGGGSGGGGIL
jgi:hypothetical protein